MFPHLHPTSEGRERAWRDGLHRVLDGVVAFATLAGAEHTHEPFAPSPASAGSAAASLRHPVRAAARPPRPASSSAPLPPPATAAARARAAVGARLVAGPAVPERAASRPHAHLHRRALRAPARSRRPGSVRAAPQPCLTPLPVGHSGRGRTHLAPSR
jgi:hypothetical protein